MGDEDVFFLNEGLKGRRLSNFLVCTVGNWDSCRYRRKFATKVILSSIYISHVEPNVMRVICRDGIHVSERVT